MSTRIFSLGFGIGTQNRAGQWLEVLFPRPLLTPDADILKQIRTILGYQAGNQVIDFNFAQATELAHAIRSCAPEQSALLIRLAESQKPTVACILELDQAPESVPEAYLKLQLISHRLCRPQQLNLTDLFHRLPNVAWTSLGPVALEELACYQLEERIKNRMLHVFSIDKLPHLTDYVVPADVQIADGARVRLGAYLGAGSKILHDGFVSFNAGTQGPNMIEGRISSGVFVGAHSNLESGSHTTDPANQREQTLITLGEHVTLECNAGTSICLGNNTYVGRDVHLYPELEIICLENGQQCTRQAQELANQTHLHFWRDQNTGAVYCQKQL